MRKVVAQLLDYGASLWLMSRDRLEELARSCRSGLDRSIFARGDVGGDDDGVAEAQLNTALDANLRTGSFVFLYVVRDLDERTERIVRYLTEGPRMPFFVVEVDHFTHDDTSIYIPRPTFTPSWAGQGSVAAVRERTFDPARVVNRPGIRVGLILWKEDAGHGTSLEVPGRVA